MLPGDVLADLNRTVTATDIAANTITTAQLNESILKYLRPEITSSPQAPGLVYGGQSVTLLSQAEGKYLTYQWNRNGQPLAGETNATLFIADFNATLHDGNYTLAATNDFGTVETDPATLHPFQPWDKRFGGSQDDYCKSVVATSDGGYLLAGYSASSVSGDKSEAGRGGDDYWVVKIDANGSKVWDKRFGGSGNDYCQSVIATTDGGYLLAGTSPSNAGGDKSEASRGGNDYWVVKIDANGSKVWDKRFGGTGNDSCNDVLVVADEGYLLSGYSDSGVGGDKSQAPIGDWDYWVIKIDGLGNKMWDKRYGGNVKDASSAVVVTASKELLIAGSSRLTPGGDWDFRAVKANSTGDQIWDKRYRANAVDGANDIVLTTEGGFLLAGHSGSSAGDSKSEGSRGSYDYWAVKADASGNKIWDKRFGGSDGDYCYSLVATNGEYILAGKSNSNASGDKFQPSRGDHDFWAIKIDANGSKVWDKRFGGSSIDSCEHVIATSDGGYLLAGHSNSPADGDKSEATRGGIDMWVVKIDANGEIVSN
jgi:hypothetical protein